MCFKLFYLIKGVFRKAYRFLTKSTFLLKNILKVIVLIIIIYLFFKGVF